MIVRAVAPKPITLNRRQTGFTLIEMMLSLTMLALIIAMSYQALVASLTARDRVLEGVEDQASLRNAHWVIGNVIDASGTLHGDAKRLHASLAQGDHPWLADVQQVQLSISQDGHLLVSLDDDPETSVLLRALQNARFSYLIDGVIQGRVDTGQAVTWVELSWTEHDRARHLRFRSEP